MDKARTVLELGTRFEVIEPIRLFTDNHMKDIEALRAWSIATMVYGSLCIQPTTV